MKPKKNKYYNEFHLAGRQYYDVNEIWDELKVGLLVRLEAEPDNKYNADAIAVMYDQKDNNGKIIETFQLGYVPSTENTELSSFLEMGWGKIFECRISQVNQDAHYESQIRLTVKIVKNKE